MTSTASLDAADHYGTRRPCEVCGHTCGHILGCDCVVDVPPAGNGPGKPTPAGGSTKGEQQ